MLGGGGGRAWAGVRAGAFFAVLALCLLHVGHARGAGIAALMVSKSIPPATVAVIDPESGTSSGGMAGTDVRIAPGDVILFRVHYFHMPDAMAAGTAAYVTEFVPANTEVVGVRLVDPTSLAVYPGGLTMVPNLPGLALDRCAGGGACGTFTLPCTGGPGCIGGFRTVPEGALHQLVGDTGIFFSTDPRTARIPANAFITYVNGQSMAGRPPRFADNIAPILGLGTTTTFYGHTAWDVDQIWAFGIANADGNRSGNQGTGETPYGYGSPVAGPQTHYPYEATDPSIGGADPPTEIFFNHAVGPWQRIAYPGSRIGTGTTADYGSGALGRASVPTALGFDLRPANPLPPTTNAVRAAIGELRAGETGILEVALRVRDAPLDPAMMRDANCAESMGTSPSNSATGSDNPWGYVIPSPACVFLNNQFDLTPDRTLAVGGERITYTLHGKNLSLLPQTNVVVTVDYDPSRGALVPGSATGAPMSATCGSLPCLRWVLGTLAPGAEYTFTFQFDVGGTGQISLVNNARYTSDQLPSPGFTTQAQVLIRPTPVLRVRFVQPTSAQPTGANITLTGTLENWGTNTASLASPTAIVPSGWTVVSATLGTTSLGPRVSPTVPATTPITLVVRAPAGTPPGLYPIDFQHTWSATGYGGSYTRLYPAVVEVPIGQARSAPPVVDCSTVLSSATRISGTHSEGDPNTVVRLFLNGIERGSDTSTPGGVWDIGTFGPGSTFGELYGGLEVRATAQAPGEAVSLPSEPCFVTFVPRCSNGFDDDGDGLADFPTDLGCAGPDDNDERNPQCADGLDNDADGLVDWPADFECSSYDDDTEAGPPACSNGLDDDGDGAVDFPADTGCASAGDRDEATRRRCANGVDDDGDGRIDFGAGPSHDPGCHSTNDDDEADFRYAPGDVRPRILLVFDTSGSMNWNVCTDTFTGGDGSIECAGADVSCAICARGGGCGNGVADDSRIALARAGVGDVIAGFGDVELGLMRFRQRATRFVCPSTNATAPSGGWAGSGAIAGSCGSFAAGDLLVGFSPENEYDMLEWVDGRDNYVGTPPAGLDIELRGSGTTPLAGALDSARAYLSGVRGGDAQASCRPYRVILLTDGQETCGGDPVASATALRTAGFPTHVIGFATRPEMSAQLDAIAAAGGTTRAIFADDRVTLASAIASIVEDAILVETCNGADDDCDGRTDEGFVLYCNRPAVGTPSLCTDPGETACNGIDDNCDGRTDEGLLNACGTCGPVPTETCNGIDDDCDALIDEAGGIPGELCRVCRPEPEACDNLDNDCDTRVDEGIVRPCGTDVGDCTIGTQTCVAGTFGACTGVGPSPEVCDNRDNDCDGIVDGIARPCGSSVGACRPGTETCTMGAFSACVGAIGPSPEVCNAVDDDCDGTVDEGNPGGGASCGSSVGACRPGSVACLAGALTCTGGVGPTTEVCNAVDDDCDGRTDESIPPGAACGACGQGRMRCVGGTMTCTGDRAPSAEVCNAVDDDCDGLVDEGNPGGGASCGRSEGACEPGTFACMAGRLVCTGGVGPSPETCNAVDDDCDGLVDEGNPGGGARCGGTDVGECESGREVCVGGTLSCVGVIGPSPERCNGLDDDCDALVDEGDPGGGAPCGDDTGECQSGITACSGGTIVCSGGIGPVEEVCNALDDDCDGVVDDGLSVGAPCGTDRGECVPGVLVCRDGATVCDGAIGPASEVCNALDDDCDGMVDEGLPAGPECGMTEGACVPGTIQCVGGRELCVGEVPAQPEACDCEDDDCDGMVDEGSEICGAGGRCMDFGDFCACAERCRDSEFARCASGMVPQEIAGECWCVPPACDDAACAAETLRGPDGTTVLCAPDMADRGIPSCVCRNNACTHACEGVVCSEGLVCRASDGSCQPDRCPEIPCLAGEFCDFATGECIPDPCASADCAPEQACRVTDSDPPGAICETSCADVACDAAERCRGGACVPDPCAGVSCSASQVCDPATGECVADMCARRACAAGLVCNPLTGDCERDPCTLLRCPAGQRCVLGECRRPPAPDAGVSLDARPSGEAGVDAAADPTVSVLARGGACACTVPGAGSGRGGSALLVLLAVALAVLRRRS